MGNDIDRRELDVPAPDGRTLHAYDVRPSRAKAELVVCWHHGTPGLGEPPAPLFAASVERGIRWIGCDRPGYGGSSADPGRDIAAVAADLAAVADALDVDRFAVLGSSGGGPHALACGALLGNRVVGVVSASGPAPYDAAGLDWFAGMSAAGATELRAAAAGRASLERQLASGEFDMAQFTAADQAALAGRWAWLGSLAGRALAGGLTGMIDDDLALVAEWGFDPASIRVPVLLLHGDEDRVVPSSHGRWLAGHIPSAELRLAPHDGHVSVLDRVTEALDWLRTL